MSNVFVAAAVGLSIGLGIGLWQGSSAAEERYARWFQAADLPAGCTRLLRDAADALNAEGESRVRAGEAR